jgi:hypothetical protein
VPTPPRRKRESHLGSPSGVANGCWQPRGSEDVGSEEARLRAGLRPPPKLHVRFSRRPVHPGFPHRLRPGTSPQALRIPPHGRHPALRRTTSSGFRSALAVTSFRFRARLDLSIPSAFSGQASLRTPLGGYGAPHLSARGTSTLLNNALLSAHFRVADHSLRIPGCHAAQSDREVLFATSSQAIHYRRRHETDSFVLRTFPRGVRRCPVPGFSSDSSGVAEHSL